MPPPQSLATTAAEMTALVLLVSRPLRVGTASAVDSEAVDQMARGLHSG